MSFGGEMLVPAVKFASFPISREIFFGPKYFSEFNKMMFVAKVLMRVDRTKKIPTDDFSNVLVQ